MKRKDFIRTSAMAGIAAVSGGGVFANALNDKKIIKPPLLRKGDKVGIAAPGSYITEEELEETKKNIRSLGLVPFYTENILAKDGYLAGTDKQRASDINRMFADKSVKAVWAARGGYGAARILGMIDYNAIRRNPKILIGYSDITALLYAVFAKTGLISFHGPVGISTFDEFSVHSLKQILFDAETNISLTPSEKFPTPLTIRSGKASGKLIGGNLSLAVSLIGTPYDVSSKGKIIFLEEINEEPYRIDRMLTQMIQADKFKDAAGIALGRFVKCSPKEEDPEFESSFTLEEVLYDRLFNLGIPVVYGLSFGHIDNKYTLPFGSEAELDAKTGVIKLTESAAI